MKQEMEDIPQTREEERRQKGPTPRTAWFLVLALFFAVALFYVPALLRSF